jgi:altronate dehydratase
MAEKRAHLHSEKDNVAVALEDLKEGDSVRVQGKGITIRIREAVPFGHKFALEPIKPGGRVIKYGEVIGEATREIQQGEHVHIHNLRSLRYT